MAWTMKYRGGLTALIALMMLFLYLGSLTSTSLFFQIKPKGPVLDIANSAKESAIIHVSDSHWMHPFANDTVYFVQYRSKSIRVEIKVSRSASSNIPRKMLLLLPGWNFSDTQWCTHTSVCSNALQRGYDVILVEMGKSVYMDSLYPQMRVDYREHPTRTWLWDDVLKPLQLKGYFTDKGVPEDPITMLNGRVVYKSLRLPIPSFVMGLSTGARGALLLVLEHPEAFKGCAGLSGDYNPLLMKSDNLMVNCLGKYDDVPWRWWGSNNIVFRIDSLRVPLYLAHGFNDDIVSWKQTESLLYGINHSKACQERLVIHEKSHSKASFVRSEIVRSAGHDYVFWNLTGLRALDYFDELGPN